MTRFKTSPLLLLALFVTALLIGELRIGQAAPARRVARLELESYAAGPGYITGVTQAAGRQFARLELETYAANLGYITDVVAAADGSMFVTTKEGKIRVVEPDGSVSSTLFLDLTGKVTTAGEHGLLSMALHPDYQNNGRFFLSYSDSSGTSILARYLISDTNPYVADPVIDLLILSQPQPFSNHNMGEILFGPDGMLYVGLGDGGSGNDPLNAGQDRTTLLGSILRIDVDSGATYDIPADNPFVDEGGGVREDIWAYGLRNPWRFSFDWLTGELYIADVGNIMWEEINLEPAGPGGVNYGWRCYEGPAPFLQEGCGDPSFYHAPDYAIDHSAFCAIVGGHVYRGSAHPFLDGVYLFADVCSGVVRGIMRDGDGNWRLMASGAVPPGIPSGVLVTTFGEDGAGELYLASPRAPGTIYKIGATVLNLDQEIFLPLVR